MSGISAGGGISTASIMDWMNAHTSALGKSIENQEAQADARSTEIEDLEKVEGDLQSVTQVGYGNTAADMQKVLADAQAAGASNLSDLSATLGPMIAQYSGYQLQWGLDPDKSDTNISNLASQATQQSAADLSTIKGVVDKLNSDDQMQLTKIQDLASQYNQDQQMASNLISSMDQTAMSVISNMKG